jgi:hypothetical protein
VGRRPAREPDAAARYSCSASSNAQAHRPKPRGAARPCRTPDTGRKPTSPATDDATGSIRTPPPRTTAAEPSRRPAAHRPLARLPAAVWARAVAPRRPRRPARGEQDAPPPHPAATAPATQPARSGPRSQGASRPAARAANATRPPRPARPESQPAPAPAPNGRSQRPTTLTRPRYHAATGTMPEVRLSASLPPFHYTLSRAGPHGTPDLVASHEGGVPIRLRMLQAVLMGE